MEQKNSYEDIMAESLSKILDDEENIFKPDKRRDAILCNIALMLAVIGDILEVKNVQVKPEN